MYQVEVEHAGLNKYRLIKGRDPYVVERKAEAQLAQWREMWERRLDAERRRAVKERAALEREEKKALAQERTADAEATRRRLESILAHTIDVDDTVDWEALKDRSPFAVPPPVPPKRASHIRQPQQLPEHARPSIRLVDALFFWRRRRLLAQAAVAHNRTLDQAHKGALAGYRTEHESWEARRSEYQQEQETNNAKIDAQRVAYSEREPEAIRNYCEIVLANSQYPDSFPQSFDLNYIQASAMLVVDYSLPEPEQLPTLERVTYVQSRDEFKERHLSETARKRLYDSVLYQIALRTVHELYEADVVEALQAIVFNGWVEHLDKATGKRVNTCILSLQAGREEFFGIDLAHVEPKACFKKLKGVGSSKLHVMTPVAPIITIDSEDKRFVASYQVADELHEGSNLAAMDWEDFEHLIREVFEAEFTASGGEVKITRASRDGGVDAIAFDPDPIRGGKIVIQAKRYTNVVGVSAVRDLYGTVVNEGATKGILVTTADYGPDAYEFAKGKPLTLLNGGNLLHLLGKHGHKAHIDIREAKRILRDREP